MAGFLTIPLELRNQIYDDIIHSVPTNALLGHELIPDKEYEFQYALRPPPESHHRSIQLVNRQIYHEFRNAIAHIVKSNKVVYEFQCLTNLDLTWTRFPVLASKIDVITLDMEAQFQGYRQLPCMFTHLEKMMQMFTRVLKDRHGDAFLPITVSQLIIDIHIPSISDLKKIHVVDEHVAVFMLSDIQNSHSLNIPEALLMREISVRKYHWSSPRFKNVAIKMGGEMVFERKNLMLAEVWRKYSNKKAGIRKDMEFHWLEEGRSRRKGKERLFD